MYPGVTPEPEYWSADLVAVWAGGARWKGDVIIFGHLPCYFSSAVSPPREEDDMLQSWQLPRMVLSLFFLSKFCLSSCNV